MKNLLSISITIIYLLGNTEFCQLLNLPDLIHHYKEDHNRNHKIDFIDFLSMHYCTDDGTSADDGEDNKLPFKQVHVTCFISAEVPNRPIVQPIPEKEALCIINCFDPQFFIKSIYLNMPLRPPAIEAYI